MDHDLGHSCNQCQVERYEVKRGRAGCPALLTLPSHNVMPPPPDPGREVQHARASTWERFLRRRPRVAPLSWPCVNQEFNAHAQHATNCTWVK